MRDRAVWLVRGAYPSCVETIAGIGGLLIVIVMLVYQWGPWGKSDDDDTGPGG